MEKSAPLVHDLKSNGSMSSARTAAIVFVVLVLLGIGSGYLLARFKSSSSVASSSGGANSVAAGKAVGVGQIVGVKDTSTFKDTAEGTLKPGGINGEGAYHLERPGGASQNVYLTSSVIDLSLYENRKIKVWGQTNAAQTAGWLMDVGRLQVLE